VGSEQNHAEAMLFKDLIVQMAGFYTILVNDSPSPTSDIAFCVVIGAGASVSAHLRADIFSAKRKVV